MRIKLCIVLLLIIGTKSILAQDTNAVEQAKHINSGFIDFNGYYDTREFSTMTINMLVKLPNRLQYFSLTNFDGPQNSSDLKKYYSEQNVHWNFRENLPFDITVQWIIRSDVNNDDLKLGLRWRAAHTSKIDKLFKKLNMYYSVGLYMLQMREKTAAKYFTQLEHVYNIKIFPDLFKNRIYLAGFADQAIVRNKNNNKIAFKWVSEHQLGFRVLDEFYIITEFRINDFFPEENYGLGYGLEYKIKF